VPKAFVDLAGAPLLVHSLKALDRAPSIAEVVVAVPATHLTEGRVATDAHGPWRCDVRLIAGGAERQDSVRKGLDAVGKVDVIVIHDAARPFVSPEVVEAAIAMAAQRGAAVVAIPATDTVKQVHADGWVEATPPREGLWLAQTPQIFRADLIRAAHANPGSGAATDDAVLVERMGAREWYLTQPARSR
jgi:2-C-methyl-D-erythritol 4-phosphate cytidylyltransferase